MKYFVDYNWERIEGKVVDSNGIYDLVQFDIDPLFDLLESIVFIIKDYFPDYSDFDENKYIYGLGVGGRLVVKGPGAGGCERSYDNILNSIKWCEKQVRLSSPRDWENKTAEDIYGMLHGAVEKQFSTIEENVPKIWTNKCSLGDLSCDLEHECVHIDIVKDDYKLRVFLKCFSANIAHQCTDLSFLYRYIMQGGKAVIGYQLLSGERGWGLKLYKAIHDLDDKNESFHRFVFDQSDEGYFGDYEYAAVVEYLSIARSFIHVVYTLVQNLSEYDPVQAEEERKKLWEMKDDIDWDNFELSDEEFEADKREEPRFWCLEGRDDYCDYFYDWLHALDQLED